MDTPFLPSGTGFLTSPYDRAYDVSVSAVNAPVEKSNPPSVEPESFLQPCDPGYDRSILKADCRYPRLE